MLLAAPVWTFWMAAVLVMPLVVVGTLATVALYFVKVVRPKYPPKGARKG